MERELGARIILFSMMSCSLLRVTRANMEGDVLNSLRASWIDPNNVLQSWNSTDVNPCRWFHVTCNYDNRVTRLDLGNANLSGQLIPQLGLLKNLQYLELLVTI